MDRTGRPDVPATAEADAMHVLLVLRADQLEGCAKNSEEARELAMIGEALEAYECKRWPMPRCQAGKGDAFRSSCQSSGDGPCGARLPLV